MSDSSLKEKVKRTNSGYTNKYDKKNILHSLIKQKEIPFGDLEK